VVETGGLENRFTLTGNGGSNPSPSATSSSEDVQRQPDGSSKTQYVLGLCPPASHKAPMEASRPGAVDKFHLEALLGHSSGAYENAKVG
jgi:hypothetical protein